MFTIPGTSMPEPGIYADMSAEAYHAVAALSKSRMDALHKSPAHFLAALTEPHEDTAATILGSLTHTLAMEPELFGQRFAAFENIKRSTKEGKANCESAEAAGLTPISTETLAQAQAMAKALREHPTASGAFLADGTLFEVSVFWEEHVNGVTIPCKARLDVLNKGLPGFGLLCADIKKTRDASPQAMRRHVAEYRYHVQAAWYRRGLFNLGLHTRQFLLLCVEDAPPYPVGLYNISEEAQGLALREIKADMETLAECMKADHWPGYSVDVLELDLPEWAKRKEAA